MYTGYETQCLQEEPYISWLEPAWASENSFQWKTENDNRTEVIRLIPVLQKKKKDVFKKNGMYSKVSDQLFFDWLHDFSKKWNVFPQNHFVL